MRDKGLLLIVILAILSLACIGSSQPEERFQSSIDITVQDKPSDVNFDDTGWEQTNSYETTGLEVSDGDDVYKNFYYILNEDYETVNSDKLLKIVMSDEGKTLYFAVDNWGNLYMKVETHQET